MKKLCYICHGLGPNGIDMLIVNILSAIDREKYDVTLIIAIDEGTKQFNEQKVRDMGIPIFRTNDMGSNRRILSHFKRLKELLKDIRPDIVHSHMGFLDGINCLAAKMAGVPMRVCHAHNSASTKDAGKSKFSVSKIYHDIYHYTMKGLCKAFSNRFCGCSEEAIGYYYGKKYLKKHKAVVINNAIDLSKFESVDRDTCMRKYGYDNSIRRIVTVGRLAEQKNPFFIVDTMRELCAIRNDVELLWIGEGHLKNQIEERIHSGEEYAIKMLGIRKDIAEIYACSDVFLLPSLFEGLGIVLIEAQAAGLPCVASTGVPELANCGKVIRLPLEDGAKAFAQTISDILDGKITMEIDEEKLSKFDIPYMIEQLEKVYEG